MTTRTADDLAASSSSASVVAIVVPCVSTERGNVFVDREVQNLVEILAPVLAQVLAHASKMMMVSFNEYPTTVSTPTTMRLTSSASR